MPMSSPTTQMPQVARATSARLVAIGTSAGGLVVLQNLLQRLPSPFPWPLVLVQHLHPEYKTHLPGILGRSSALPVREAEDGDRLCPNTLYTAPNDQHLRVAPGRILRLDHEPTEHFSRPSINVLFRSVAEVYRDRAIALLLTGSNADGAEGMRAIKDAGGITFVQSPATAFAKRMPQAAIATGAVDFVLTPEEMADKLAELIQMERS